MTGNREGRNRSSVDSRKDARRHRVQRRERVGRERGIRNAMARDRQGQIKGGDRERIRQRSGPFGDCRGFEIFIVDAVDRSCLYFA